MYHLLVLLGLFCTLSSSSLISTVRQNPQLQGTASVTVDITNVASHAVAILRWSLPFDNRIDSHTFFVQLNGQEVTYIGPVAKYAGPYADDYIFINSNQTISVDVELQNLYDFTQPGTYTVMFMTDVLDYVSQKEFGKVPRPRQNFTPYPNVISNFLEITTITALTAKRALAPYPCSAGENNQISQGAASGRTMIGYALSEINQGQTATYDEWFGAYSDQRYNVAEECIRLIQQNTVVGYACDDRANVYAYVYPADSSHTIYFCSAFWGAPVAGGWDTKAGTIIHELSHFNNIGGTGDWAYGTAAARNLARTNPTRAVNNADNFEYFSESLW